MINPIELPDDWDLKPSYNFTDQRKSGKFWPKDLFIKQKSNKKYPVIKSFTFFSKNRMIVINNNSDIDKSHPYSAKFVGIDGSISDWKSIGLQLNSNKTKWNKNCLKLFEFNDFLYNYCRRNNKTLIKFQISLVKHSEIYRFKAKQIVRKV